MSEHPYERELTLPRSGDVSPPAFIAEVLDYWKALGARRDSLHYAYEIFSLESPVSSEQCARSLAHLRPIKELIQGLCDLVEHAAFLQGVTAASHETFLIRLYYSVEQLGMAIALIRAQREACQLSHGPAATQGQVLEIRSMLKMLLGDFEEILHEAQWLRDRVILSRV